MFISKIHNLSITPPQSDFSKGMKCSSSFYWCRLRRDRSQTFLKVAMPAVGARYNQGKDRRIWSDSSPPLTRPVWSWPHSRQLPHLLCPSPAPRVQRKRCCLESLNMRGKQYKEKWEERQIKGEKYIRNQEKQSSRYKERAQNKEKVGGRKL